VKLSELKESVGAELGSSGWHEIAQERIQQFAEATNDHQWIHVDPEMARQGPFGTTIAHGYLTLSLIPFLMSEVWRVEDAVLGVNYGLNRVRFPAPVPSGSRVRLHAKLLEAEEIPRGVQVVVQATIEVEGNEKPVCVAETVSRLYGSEED
jgi:acyl dehydratase